MVLIIEISKIGNILATENQQARINGVIEVKKACICTKLKQIQLRKTKSTPSSSNGQDAEDTDKMGISGVALCLLVLKWI